MRSHPPLRAPSPGETAAPLRPRPGGIFVAIGLGFLSTAVTAAPPTPPGRLPPPATVPPATVRLGLVDIDPGRRTITIPARIHQTNGVLEYVLVADYGKTHESLLVTDAAAQDVQAALLLLRAHPSGTNAVFCPILPPLGASAVHLALRWPATNPVMRLPLADAIRLASPGGAPGETTSSLSITGRLHPGPWLFNGSTFSPEGFVAHFEGSLISLIRDPGAILNNPGPDRDDDDIHVPAPGLPPYGTPVLMELAVPLPPP